jgi:acid stress-induced BolA-like protein IbaG/YrbA
MLLLKKGIDEKILKEININIALYGSKVELIEENENYVRVYLSEYVEAIKKIPLRVSILVKEESLEIDLKTKLAAIKNELKLKFEAILTKIKRLQELQNNLNIFMKEYQEKINNQTIERDIQNILSLYYAEDMEHLLENKEFLTMVISNLISGHEKLSNNQDAIINKTSIATKGLDKSNIFKLDIVDDDMEAKNSVESYRLVAEGLIAYIENDKISVLKETSSSRFKNHLNSIQKYIKIFDDSIMDIERTVTKLGNRVKKAVESFKVIDSIQISTNDANNYTLEKLKEVTSFYSKNSDKFLLGLFPNKENLEENRKAQDKLADKIDDLVMLLASGREYLSLQEGFVLEFRVTENGNRLNPALTLNDIGSNGTSTLVKTIINISILQMVNNNSKVINHCILDEIGTISPKYFRELKDYANESGFLFVNGMPTEDDILISMYPTVYVGQKYGKDSRMLLASKMVV